MEKQLFGCELDKLGKILAEENLAFLFTGSYPIKLTITPRQDMEGQMDMLADADKDTPVNSPDARLILTYRAGDVELQIFGRMAIDDDLYRKVRSSFKNACLYYLAWKHREGCEAGAVNVTLASGGDDV